MTVEFEISLRAFGISGSDECACVCVCAPGRQRVCDRKKMSYTLVPVKPSICICRCGILNEVVAFSEQISLLAQLVCGTFNLSL